MAELTKGHEKFCQSYVLDTNGAKAAREAGYSTRTAKYRARQLLKRKDINHRLNELRAEISRTQCLNIDSLMVKLETLFRKCMAERRYASACKAIEIQARLAGVFPMTRIVGSSFLDDDMTPSQPNVQTICPIEK